MTLYCNANGNDSNDGTSETDQGGGVGPWLTANTALDQLALSANDGQELIFGDGTYTYTNNSGRWICSHALVTINPTTDFGTTLIFDGAISQGMRFNADTSGAEPRTINVGKIYIGTSNAAKSEQLSFVGNNVLTAKQTVNLSCKTIPPTSGAASVIGVSINCSNIDITLLDGSGCSGSGTTLYRGVYYVPATAVSEINIDIQSYQLENTQFATPSGVGVIELGTNNAITGSWSVSSVTGTHTDTGATGSTYIVRISGGPDDSIIKNTPSLTVTMSNAARSIIPYCIESASALLITTNRPKIENNREVVLNADNGFMAIIGNEGGDHNTPNGVIERNKIRVNPINVSTYGMHGVCNIGCLNGVRKDNDLDGPSIGSLTKGGTGYSTGNVIKNVGGATKAFLYAKGAESGTRFAGDICIIPDGYDGDVELALLDDTAFLQNSTGVEFIGTKVVYSGGDFAASATLHTTGSASDTSDSVTAGMDIDDNFTLPAVIVQKGASTYAAIAGANQNSEVMGISQSNLITSPALRLFSTSGGIIGSTGSGIIGYRRA